MAQIKNIYMKLSLNLADVNLDSSRPGTSRFASSRAIQKRNINLVTVEQGLDSLDVFRDLLEGIPHQKNRVVRDVCKAIQLEKYHSENIIYDIGEKATAVYICLQGEVSISIINYDKPIKTSRNAEQKKFNTQPEEEFEVTYQYEEIDTLKEGEGFGEAQFISNTKRTVRAIAMPGSLIGKLELQSFSEVLENYKMRVYFKKRDMFEKCALFRGLNQKKLEFIINNTKPMTLNISQKLFSDGDAVDYIYLVNKGQITLHKNHKSQQKIRQGSKKYQCISKIKSTVQLQESLNKKVFFGLLQQGSFMGDMEVALGKKFSLNAVATTEKAELYYCNKKIILSQMTQENLEEVRTYYQKKQEYMEFKMKQFTKATVEVEKKQQIDLLPPLTVEQLKMKRMIHRRHSEVRPSLIGHSSPADIEKMINRKAVRAKTQPSEGPILEVFCSKSEKKRSHVSAAFKPIALVDSPLNKIRKDSELSSLSPVATANPQDESDETEIKKMKSLFIRIKPTKLSLKTVKEGQSENMSKIKQIIGPYRKSARPTEIDKLIKQIQFYTKG